MSTPPLCEQKAQESLPSISLLPQLGKQQHIPNRDRIRQQHHQSVNPQASPRSGGQPMLQCNDLVLVMGHRLLLPIPTCCLTTKMKLLLLRVVELGETIGNLHAMDEKLKPLSQLRSIITATGKG